MLRVTQRDLKRAGLAVVVIALVLAVFVPLNAQKIQEEYGDKFKVAPEDGGVSIATSADGRYVFVAGKKGVLVSDDFGKTGSWVQTVRMK